MLAALTLPTLTKLWLVNLLISSTGAKTVRFFNLLKELFSDRFLTKRKETTKRIKAAAIMTAARYECTAARNYIEIALKRLGIPLTVSGGVFYGQCMQKMLEQLVATDCEYAITIDGDTLFTAPQLQRLLSIISQEEQIDAITGIQVRRNKLTMLGTVHGGKKVDDDFQQVDWNGYPLKARTAHFGLTVIDLQKLRSVAKPWFCATPNAKGEWEDDKIDDDVHFWLQWEKAGNSIYIDPGVRLGHLEEMIAVFDENMQPQHMYVNDWAKQNAS